MKRILVFMFLGPLLISCQDPNESGVPDGKDFKTSTVNWNDPNLVANVYFYADIDLNEFFFYFDHNDDSKADFLIKCKRDEFRVLKESTPGSGLYDVLKYTGTPALSAGHYRLEFPLAALELEFDPNVLTYYWFYAMDGGDRMPDSGRKTLDMPG